MKTVMITGAKGYIGSALGEWFEKQKKYRVIRINTKAVRPENILMEGCDTVVHTAGIAHQKETKDNAPLYYEINRDYAVQTAVQARKAGVQQFILLSSMSVYGKQTGRITKETVPAPVSHYGRSKYQADLKIRDLESDTFRVCILRPPMVYGKGCKGNYQALRKRALKTLIFPDWKNQRSMLYIENLCGFIQQLTDAGTSGLFFPQNRDYICTAELVRQIAAAHGKKIRLVKCFNPMLRHLHLGLFEKVFGSLIYDCPEDECLQVKDFVETIYRTEQ